MLRKNMVNIAQHFSAGGRALKPKQVPQRRKNRSCHHSRDFANLSPLAHAPTRLRPPKSVATLPKLPAPDILFPAWRRDTWRHYVHPMKALFTLLVSLCFAAHTFAQAPKMTKQEVTQLGKRILATKSKPYTDGFLLDTPQYSPKEGLWKFQPTGPLASGAVHALIYFFEVRDADGSHRIGSLGIDSGYVPRSSQFFKPSPGMKRKPK